MQTKFAGMKGKGWIVYFISVIDYLDQCELKKELDTRKIIMYIQLP